MQPTVVESESSSSFPSFYPSYCKRSVLMLPSSPSHQNQNHDQLSAFNQYGNDTTTTTSTYGGPFFLNTSSNYQLLCGGSDIYDAAHGAGAAAAAATVLPRALLHSSAHIGGILAVSGKSLFTAAQWLELERQTEICKYIMNSVPVPPQLLFYSYNNNPSHPLGVGTVSQSCTSALDLRFSSGTGPEPWRCRRTDGKKWRCSRDVAPDQKYCERHAHKSRPRSRKPVEIQSHNDTNCCTQQSFSLLSDTSTQLLQRPIVHFPTMASVASYDLTRGIEWFSKGDGGTTPVSTCNQQWQQMMQSSSRAEVKRNKSKHNKEEYSFQNRFEDKRPIPFMHSNSAERSENHQLNALYCNSFPDPKAASFQGNLNTHTTQTTRHFIDAWSTAEKGLDKISKKGSPSSTMKLPPSSLMLSIPGGNDIDEDNEYANIGFRMMMMNTERSSSAEWMSPATWMGSTPGGPLGEALCLGVADLPSPHGYGNSTSSCSRSSCEDGSHGLHFIG